MRSLLSVNTWRSRPTNQPRPCPFLKRSVVEWLRQERTDLLDDIPAGPVRF
jgi:hypothetical protein